MVTANPDIGNLGFFSLSLSLFVSGVYLCDFHSHCSDGTMLSLFLLLFLNRRRFTNDNGIWIVNNIPKAIWYKSMYEVKLNLKKTKNCCRRLQFNYGIKESIFFLYFCFHYLHLCIFSVSIFISYQFGFLTQLNCMFFCLIRQLNLCHFHFVCKIMQHTGKCQWK